MIRFIIIKRIIAIIGLFLMMHLCLAANNDFQSKGAAVPSSVNNKDQDHQDQDHQDQVQEAQDQDQAQAQEAQAHDGEDEDVVTVTTNTPPETAVETRSEKESIIPPNYFAITFYKPNYILPFYFTGSPDNKVYRHSTPGNEQIKKTEVKFQLSLKVPIWKDIFCYPSSLYFAYTQLSYWQAYNKTAFFRETDYEPEFFLANEINFRLFKKWTINFINIGLVHQSNGFGDRLERSWNRLYVEAITSNDVLMFSIKPWIVFYDGIYNQQNPHMADYLGYGEITLAYKFGGQIFSLQAHSLFEQGGRHITGLATWSFPLTPYFYGFVQVFSGYGQSLIEYNHRTNSFGLGIALSNWI